MSSPAPCWASLKPTVGLLNVGSEEVKGHEAVREAAAHPARRQPAGRASTASSRATISPRGTVDVIVTDGFTGNVALKTLEGTAKLYAEFLQRSFKSSLIARVGYLLARPALNALRVRTDPRRYNGAIFLGLNGVAVKSHGGTDALGFANAIGVAVDMITQKSLDKIREDFARFAAGNARQPAGGRALMVVRSQRGRLRRLSAAAGRHQCRAGRPPRDLRRMDRPAHRHPPAPYRGRRRD